MMTHLLLMPREGPCQHSDQQTLHGAVWAREMCRNTQSWKHTSSPVQAPCPGIKWGCEHISIAHRLLHLNYSLPWMIRSRWRNKKDIFHMRKKQELHIQWCRLSATQTYLEVDDSGLLGCGNVLLGVQLLTLKITVAPSLSKEEVFFLDCLPLKTRCYELWNITSDPARPESSKTQMWESQMLHNAKFLLHTNSIWLQLWIWTLQYQLQFKD